MAAPGHTVRERHNAPVPSIVTHASYDEVPYEAGLSPATHPQNAAVIARLFGLRPADVRHARVLEIGCGAGNNLLPMAYSLPEASFVGVDLAAAHVRAAVDSAERLGLSNTVFLQADIRDFAPDGQFDYIICHGVFSWVPPDARTSILALCRKALSPQGIAHISYNAMPGWHVRGAFREMLRSHARFFSTPEERIDQARAFASFLSDSTAQLTSGSATNAAYHTMLQEEFALIQRLPDFYVLHEHLADDNQAFYFLDFLDELNVHGLRYLGDANFASMLTENLPREVAASLDAIAPTRDMLEQYRDFVVDRHFRQSLVVRDDIAVDPRIDADVLRGLTARAALLAPEDGVWQIPQAAGTKRPVESALVVATLETLAAVFPGSMPFAELRAALPEAAWPSDPGASERDQQLVSLLLSLFATDAVELRSWDPAVERDTPERPIVFRPAAILDTSLGVPTPHHTTVGLNSPGRWLLQYADGTRTASELAELLFEEVERGRVALRDLETRERNDRALAARLIADGLEQLRRSGLLEPGQRTPGGPR